MTCYSYDLMHRLTSVTYPSGPNASVTPSKFFVYDSATVNNVLLTNTKGRLAEAYTVLTGNNTDLGFSYSARGEVANVLESTPHSNGYYSVAGLYWENGVTKRLSGLPGIPTFNYGVDGEGRISTISATSGQNPVTLTTFDTASRPNVVTLGSGDSDNYLYDPNTGRMTQYKFTVGATPQNVIGSLGWNANGSLAALSIADPFNSANSQNCSYAHDDLSRIASVNCGPVWGQTFGYDAFTNITKSGSSSSSGPYSSTTNRNSGMTYDLLGNLLIDGIHTYSWDAESRAVGVDGVLTTYDALGRAVERSTAGGYAEFVYGLNGGKLASMNGQIVQTASINLPGGGQAVYGSSGLLYYRHSDWLGSSRFASTPDTRAAYSSGAYAPFAEPYAESGTLDRVFTGQTQDTSGVGTTGLYDFLFRRYSSTQGRWISPDPAGNGAVDPSNPQSWNRYAYVINSPLDLIDPYGLSLANPNCDVSVGAYIPGEGEVLGHFDQSIYCYPINDFNGGSSGFGGSQGGGGARVSIQNKQLHCAWEAAKEKGISIGLDVAGAIPGLGNVTSASVAIVGAGYGIATVGNDPVAANSAFLGVAVPTFDMLLGGTKALPVVGNVVSGLTGLYDIYGAAKAYQSCISN